MKKLLILTLLFSLAQKSNGQIPTRHADGRPIANEQAKLVMGSSYVNAPQVTKRSDGTWEVRGDSMKAIKMLWREIERMNSAHEAEKAILFNAISKQSQQIKACSEYRKDIDKIIKSLKP